MASIGTIEGLIRLRDEFTGVLTRASTQLQQTGAKAKRIGQMTSEAGSQLTRAVTLPLAAVGGLAVKAFGDFDDAMTGSLAIMGDVSETMRDRMGMTAREVAKTIDVSAKQAAESYFFLASAGLDAAASVEALPVVAKFGQAGLFDMARATDLLTDAQSALGLTIRDDVVANMTNMSRVSDVLVKANTVANASVEQFATALTSKAGTAMKQLNIEVESGVAVLAAWADQGVKAELAGERFNIVTRDLQRSYLANRQAFKQYNIEVFDAAGQFRNMADIIEDLEGALGGMSTEQQKVALGTLGFQERSVQATKSLIGLSDQIKDYETKLRAAGGITEEVANKQMQSLWKQLKLVKDRLVDVGITLGQSLGRSLQEFATGTLVPMIDKLAGLAKWFTDLPRPIQNTVFAIAAMVAIAGPLLIVLGGLITAFGSIAPAMGSVLAFISGPAGWIAAGVALLATWKPIRDFVISLGSQAISGLTKWIGVLVSRVREWWASTADARKFLAALARVIMADVVAAVRVVVGWVKSLVTWQINLNVAIVKAVVRFLEWSHIMDVVRFVGRALVDNIKLIWDWIKKATSAIVGWVGGLDGIVRVLRIANPAAALMIDKLKEWAEKAKANAAATEETKEKVAELGETITDVANTIDTATDQLDDFGGSMTALGADAKATKEALENELAQIRVLMSAHRMGGKAVEDLTIHFEALNSVISDTVSVEEAMSGGLVELAEKVIRGRKALQDMSTTADRTVLNMTRLQGAFTDNSRAIEQNAERYELLSRTSAGVDRSLSDLALLINELTLAMARGIITEKQFEEAMQRLATGVDDTKSIFADMDQAFAHAIANMIVNARSLGDSLKAMFEGRIKQAFTSLVSSMIKGFGKAMAAGDGFKKSIAAAFGAAKKAAKAATAGVKAYAVVWAAVIVAVVAIWKRHKKAAIDTAKELAKSWKVEISDKLAKDIDNLAKRLGNLAAAFRQHLPRAIREASISSASDLRKFINLAAFILSDFSRRLISAREAVTALSGSIGGLLDAFSSAGGTILELNGIANLFLYTIKRVEMGVLDASHATSLLDKSFDQFVETALTMGDLGLRAIQRITAAAKEAGVESEAITNRLIEAHKELERLLEQRSQFLVDQARDLLAAVDDILANLGKRVFDVDFSLPNISGMRDIEFAVTAITQAFNAMMLAGAPLSEIVATISAALDKLQQRATDLGLKLPEPFQRLSEMMDILSKGPIKRMITNLEGLAAAAQAAGNMGMLTAEQFDLFGDRLRKAFRRLKRGGLSGAEALAALAPQLQLLRDLSQQYGFELDKNTQKLIEQADAAGLLTDKQLSTEDILMRGFDRMLEALNALITALGGVPVALEDWERRTDRPTEDVEKKFDSLGDTATTAAKAAVTAWEWAFNQIAKAAEGLATITITVSGNVADVVTAQHGTGMSDFGKGTVAVLHGREQVVTQSQGQGIAAMVAAAIGGGGRDPQLQEIVDSIGFLSSSLHRQQAVLAVTARDAMIKGTTG